MRGAIRLLSLVSAWITIHHVSSFSIPDFHLMQTAASHLTHSVSHVAPHVAKHVSPQTHDAFDLLGIYKQTLTAHPLTTKMLTGATLAVSGDAIAQSQDKSTEYDKQRAASFAAFDMAYRAVQHFSFPIIVAACHGQYLGSLPFLHDAFDASRLGAMEQTLASQLGIVPFFYYPVFFSLTGFMQGLTLSGAVSRAQENFLPLMKRNLLFWIPVQYVQFGYIPEDLQIPFLSMCGLAWTFILSVAAGSARNYTPDNEMEKDALNVQKPEQAEQDTAATPVAQRS